LYKRSTYNHEKFQSPSKKEKILPFIAQQHPKMNGTSDTQQDEKLPAKKKH
jgi:hypothetical protein